MTSGWSAALTAWRGDAADTYATRMTRYGVLWGFYLNDVYDTAANVLATYYKEARSLYSDIKPIYNPVSRLVDFYVAKVPGEVLIFGQDDVTEAGEPYPVVAEPEVADLISDIRRWSHWGRMGSLWIRYAAALGDGVLRVVTPDTRSRPVQIQVHHPADLVEADFDRFGNVEYAVFEYEAQERIEGEVETYTYRQEITPESFATYRDGREWDYREGLPGGQYSWANPFGFVPVVVTRHKVGGSEWGLCCFHHVIPKIDDVNDLASHLGAQIRKAIHPQWVSFGTKAGSGMERNDKLWHHPNPQGKVEALVEDINIAAVTADIQERLTEIEKDCPELKAGRVGDNNRDVSGRAVTMMLGDIVDRVIEARKQYDSSLVMAQEMALRMGAVRKVWPERDFSHTIAERDVFPPDEAAMLSLETQRKALEIQELALEQQRALGMGG
jgi:hypothetical protein